LPALHRCTMLLTWIALLTGASFSAFPAVVAAQRSDGRLAEMLRSSQQRNNLLLIQLVSGDSIIGRVRSINRDSSVIIGGEETALSALRTVSRRTSHGDPIANGIVLGLSIGGVVGLIAPYIREPNRSWDSSTQLAVSVAGGATIGALLGIVLDTAVGRRLSWTVLWP
jgi:hypothetical protein